jgi:hypothetical protein
MAADPDVEIIDVEDETNRGGRPPDPIWEHFEKLPGRPGSTRKAGRCNHCRFEIGDGRIGYLYKHISFCRVATPEIKLQCVQMQAKKAVATALPAGRKRKLSNQAKGSSLQQTKVTSYGQGRLPDAVMQTCHVKLLRMVIMTSSSFTLVDDPFFVDFIQTLSPGYNPPGMLHQECMVLQEIIAGCKHANVIMHGTKRFTRMVFQGGLRFVQLCCRESSQL